MERSKTMNAYKNTITEEEAIQFMNQLYRLEKEILHTEHCYNSIWAFNKLEIEAFEGDLQHIHNSTMDIIDNFTSILEKSRFDTSLHQIYLKLENGERK
jgi:hypothetical protein